MPKVATLVLYMHAGVVFSLTRPPPITLTFLMFAGGIYWIGSLVTGQLGSFIAAYLYVRNNGGGGHAGNDEKQQNNSIVSAMVTLELVFLAAFAFFILNIKKEYIPTFFTTTTAKQFACDCYFEATTDETRIEIFGHHESYFASIREELKEWVEDNWTKWNDEKPDWLTTRVIGSIPDDIIPKEVLLELKENGRVTIRRRSSVADALNLVEGGRVA